MIYIYIYIYTHIHTYNGNKMEHKKAKKLMITNLLKVIYVNTKVRCTLRNMTNFNQKIKILKALNFRYDTEMKIQLNENL